MNPNPHSPAWYDDLSETQEGYYYPWKSQLPPWHGEDLFRQMVKQHISPTSDVLEVACAHGELTLELAPLCRSVVGYDRIPPWIDRAQRAAEQQGVTNVNFLCHDSSLEANGSQARLPGDNDSYDLLICSKGPFHWMEDARRVARPGAVLLMLVPDAEFLFGWNSLLPESLRRQEHGNPNWARPTIEQRLALGGLELDSWWSFDVPQYFPDLEQLYIWLSWGKAADEIPTFTEMRPVLEQISQSHGTANGLCTRYRRYIWKAIAY